MKFLFIILVLTSCGYGRIIDAEKATLVSAERVRHTGKWICCVQTESGKRVSFKRDCHGWRCKSPNTPQNWNVVYLRNGKSYSQPVK